MIPVSIAWVTLLVECPCPALPDDGTLPPYPPPTDWPTCGKPAGWWIGEQHCCDDHMRRACDEAEWDWDGLLADVGRSASSESESTGRGADS